MSGSELISTHFNVFDKVFRTVLYGLDPRDFSITGRHASG
jgi:hypothetical protein